MAVVFCFPIAMLVPLLPGRFVTCPPPSLFDDEAPTPRIYERKWVRAVMEKLVGKMLCCGLLPFYDVVWSAVMLTFKKLGWLVRKMV